MYEWQVDTNIWLANQQHYMNGAPEFYFRHPGTRIAPTPMEPRWADAAWRRRSSGSGAAAGAAARLAKGLSTLIKLDMNTNININIPKK